jgi:hypothetical protein
MTVTVNIWVALFIIAAAMFIGWLIRNNNKGVKINQKP